MSYFLLDAFARFFIALLLIPLIIYVYTNVATSFRKKLVLGQLMHLLYVLFLVFLTDDLFFKFMYLRQEFKEFLVQEHQELVDRRNFFVIL